MCNERHGVSDQMKCCHAMTSSYVWEGYHGYVIQIEGSGPHSQSPVRSALRLLLKSAAFDFSMIPGYFDNIRYLEHITCVTWCRWHTFLFVDIVISVFDIIVTILITFFIDLICVFFSFSFCFHHSCYLLFAIIIFCSYCLHCCCYNFNHCLFFDWRYRIAWPKYSLCHKAYGEGPLVVNIFASDTKPRKTAFACTLNIGHLSKPFE